MVRDTVSYDCKVSKPHNTHILHVATVNVMQMLHHVTEFLHGEVS